ncbi:hypothetical protein C8R44DRAFT_990760 [Mycena epipterygia]|nr:hypothetical protein C8R44DRAFT_990760 [Mycena epipterygia]
MSTPPSHGKTLPLLAAVGAACCHCHRLPSGSAKLQKCSGCRLVSYCNSSCQHDSWPAHKQLCRVVGGFENKLRLAVVARSIQATTPEELITYFNQRFSYYKQNLGGAFSLNERILLQYEPICLFCGRNDQLIRIDAWADPSFTPQTLVPCSNCHLSVACENHWPLVKAEHTQMMCEGGYDGLPQCVLNQELLEDDEWDAQMLLLPVPIPQYRAETYSYLWIPAPVKNVWTSFKNITWVDRFQTQLESEFPAAHGSASSVWMRRMSDVLSLPMTALYALELLNDNLDWTRKETLTIHILDARYMHLFNADCFENILHQLPQVKSVKLVICGVAVRLAGLHGGPHAIDCCLDCHRRGRKRYDEYYDVVYENLPSRMGDKYSIPDLAIATTLDLTSMAAWKTTVAFLVSHRIPSVFTSQTQDEGISINSFLGDAGARLVPGLGTCRNPWGSLLSKKDNEQPRSFFAENMYLAGGFKGR